MTQPAANMGLHPKTEPKTRSQATEASNPWNDIFGKDGKVFLEPHEELPKLTRIFHEKKVKTVLDLGSGTGRHVVFLAEEGFKVYGIDYAANGVEINQRWLNQLGLEAEVKVGDIYEPLPFEDEFFDAVISTQTLHHARREKIAGLITELERVMRPEGLLFVTVPVGLDSRIEYDAIEANTYVPLSGGERGLTHFIFTPLTLLAMFANFRIVDLSVDAHNHYALTGYKRKVAR